MISDIDFAVHGAAVDLLNPSETLPAGAIISCVVIADAPMVLCGLSIAAGRPTVVEADQLPAATIEGTGNVHRVLVTE